MKYVGDFAPGQTVYVWFDTSDMTGAGATLSGSPVVRVYKNASDVEDDSGIVLTADFDSKTGLGHVSIDTSADGTFFSTGADFAVVITVGTVDGVSIAPKVLAQFSLANRHGAAVAPTSAWEAGAPVKSLGTAIMTAVHKIEDDAGTFKVYRSNGSTLHASGAIVTDPAKQPIDEIAGLA